MEEIEYEQPVEIETDSEQPVEIDSEQDSDMAQYEHADPVPDPEEIEESLNRAKESGMLEPDHPLLARFQRVLKEQLERQIRRLSDEVIELEIGVKKKTSDRDSLGVAVYDAQQMVAKQQEMIGQYESEMNAYVTDRTAIETDLVQMRDTYKQQKNLLNEAIKKETELRSEVETVSFMMTQMTEWEGKLQSDLAVNQRISEKTKLDKKQYADEKRQLDFIIYKLMTDIFRLESSLDNLDMQLRVKEEEREDVANMIAAANADVESLETERKRLMHSWNCVLVAIGHRDKSYLAARTELELEQEKMRNIQMEISSIKKMSNEEMGRNEQLTLVKGRLDMSKQSVQANLVIEKNKFSNLERKITETQAILTQTVKDLDMIILERKLKEQEIGMKRRELEKYVALKVELENKILELLQDQITSDKISKYMNKTIRDLREKNRDMEIQLSTIENKNADIMVAIEHQKMSNEETRRGLNEIIRQEVEEEKDVAAKSTELHNLVNSINKKQMTYDLTNKKLEDLMNKTGGLVLSPQEVKIKELERQIAEIDEKNQKLKGFWLRQQNYIVSLNEQRQKQLHDFNIIRKQTMLLEQKNLKLEDELEELNRQDQIADRTMATLMNKIDKISQEALKKRGQKDTLDINTVSFRNEYVLKLKDAELECIRLEAELADLEDEKLVLSKELIEANREHLAWDRKLKMAVETKQIIAKEKGAEGEIGGMRAEIHRMGVRYGQLRKAQEKLIQDLNHCIARREFIFINADAAEKRLTTGGGKANNRMNFKRRIEDMKIKVKKTVNEKKEIEAKMKHAIELENQLYEKINEYEQTTVGLKDNINDLIVEIETCKTNRQKELEVLVYKQHKLRAITYIAKDQYKSCHRTACALDSKYNQQKELNYKLQTVVENLMLDFPNHFVIFDKILNTLKLVHS